MGAFPVKRCKCRHLKPNCLRERVLRGNGDGEDWRRRGIEEGGGGDQAGAVGGNFGKLGVICNV